MILSLRDVSAGYGAASALRGLTLHVDAGETVALVGANGAGKTTLLKAVSGLVRVTGGEIAFDGATLAGVPPSVRVARGIAHVPEGRDVFGSLTVGENLRLGAYALRGRAGAREIETLLDDVLARFPILRERLDRPAAELSGGQQQMLAIGRGLMAKPRLLLLDEPSLGLAPALVDQIFAIVRDVRSLGVTVLIAEQNARMALALADRGYVLENGRIVAQGTGRELLGAPEIVERYLGIGEVHADRGADARSAALSARLAAILGTPASR